MFQQQPELEAPEGQWAAYDPWEAVEVAWDGKSGGYAGSHSAFAGKRKTDFNQLLKHASLPDSEANIFGNFKPGYWKFFVMIRCH